MKQELLFGAAYYPEYLPVERSEKDICMMKEAGMNVIRIAESTWSTLEPSEGVFHFSYIDRMLELAEAEGMKLIIGTPTYAIPVWLSKKAQDIMVTRKEGQARYGARQLMNIVSPVFRVYAERVIRKLMERTAHRECVIGFQIDNETKHYGTADREVQKLFVSYLQEHFSTVENLNKSFGLAYWSNSISDWEDFPDMLGCINGGLSSEFEKFQRGLVSEYLMWQSAIVQEYKNGEQFITHNFDFEWKKFGANVAQDGYSYGVQPDVNHLEACGSVTLAGTDIYHPTQDDLTGAEIGFCGDSIRSLKPDNYLVLECQAQAFKYWTPYPGQLRLHAYSHLASGACGILYWNWHSIHSGYETYWKGLLSHDFDTNPAYEEACVFGKEWKRLGEQLVGLKKQNKVALVVDNHSLTAFKWFPMDKDLSYNDVVRRAYDCLYEMNVECDVIDAALLNEKSNVEKYKVLVTPALYSISEKQLETLKDFAENGGCLVSTFKSFVADEHLQVYHDKQPHILHECFGMSYNQYTQPVSLKAGGCSVSYLAELLKPVSAVVLAAYEHPYWGKYAAITENEYGEGKCYYIGCFAEKEVWKNIFTRAMETAASQDEEMKKQRDGIHFSRAVFPVIIRSGLNASGDGIHYVLHYSSTPGGFRCPYGKVIDLLTGQCYSRGDMIPLKDWDVCILQERQGDNND